ncbi:MAG: hypothetical protein RLZZ414_1072 [Bacteroidota bacterium]|jgi:hypothetical protein
MFTIKLGRKEKFAEPTKTISFRVPEKRVDYYKEVITNLILSHETSEAKNGTDK